jgi:hypothetical protein
MTAPALLGVSGSSLLIAASIVFVALAWTVFTPMARGLIVSGVAVLVSLIALWLKKLGLTISSGAVGFVAMGFAGTATLAFSRGTGALGGYDIPTALLVACGAGLVLARLGIQWVGSAAALALAGAAVGYTVVATQGASAPVDPDTTRATIRGLWVWVTIGTVTASGLALTYRMWKPRVAKVAVQWVSVVWLSLVGAGASVWMWARDGIPADAAFALLPIIALAVLARWWPLLATGPAAFLATLLAPAMVSTWEPGLWQQATAVAVAVAALLALGPWAPRVIRLPMLIGVSPGYVTVALAAAVYSVSITVVRIIAGTYVPDTNMWAGVAALVAGLSIAQLRLWKLDSPWVKAASGVGAVMVITGMGIVAFGLAEAWNKDYHSSVAVTMTVGAVALLLVMRVWAYREAAVLTGVGAWAFVLVAAGHSTWAVVVSEIPVAFAVLLAAAPIALLVFRGRTHPWWGMVPAALFLTLLAAAIASRYDAPAQLVVAAAVAAAGIVLWGMAPWSGQRVPATWAQPVALGLVPALLVGLSAGAFTAVDVMMRAAAGRSDGLDGSWTAPALVTAIALGGLARWKLDAAVLRAAGIAGAVTVLLAATGAAFDAADQWGASTPAAVSGFGVVASLAAVAFTALWRSTPAAWVNGIGASALLTVSGLNAVITVTDTAVPLWAPVGFASAAIAVLVIFGRWWPVATYGSASFLITALAAALVSREWGGAPALAVAAVVAAGLLWAATRLTRRRRLPLTLGLIPLTATAAMVAFGSAGAAITQVFVWGAADMGELDSWWAVLLLAALIAGVAAVWRAEPATRTAVGMRTTIAAFAIVTMAVLTVTIGTTARGLVAASADASWAWLASATGAGVLCAAGILWASRRESDSATGEWLPRGALRVGAVVWLTMLGLSAAWATRLDSVTGAVGAAATAVVLALLVAIALKRPVLAAAPTALLSTFVAFVAVFDRFGFAAGAFASTAVAAAAVWLLARAQGSAQLATALGLMPAGALALTQVGAAVLDATRAYSDAIDGSTWIAISMPLWSFGSVVMVAAAALAVQRVRAHAGTVVLAVAAVLVALLVPLAAGLVLAALALAAAVLGKRSRSRDEFAAIAAALATGWVIVIPLGLAAVLAVLAAIGVLAARRQQLSGVRWGLPVAAQAAGGAAAVLVAGLGGTAILIAPSAMFAIVATVLVMAHVGLDKGRELTPWLLGITTVVVPALSPGLAPKGVALLVAGVAWFAAAVQGERAGRWWAASALSLGAILIVAESGVSHIEAYTAAPAAAALTLGLLWMRDNPEVRSLQALWPGLSLALFPSYVALITDPDSLLRTASLTVAIIALAIAGVRLKWFAPILATAVTAVVVSVLQVLVGSNLVLRLVSFVVVGSLLLAIASWFEKLKTLR